jgi:tetratricopeptide (TPR) repeat protein
MAILDQKLRKLVLSLIIVCLIVPYSLRADDETDSLEVLYNNLAVIEALNGDFALAMSHLDSLRSFVPASPALLTNLGNCYLCLAMPERAIAYYDSAFHMDSTDERIVFNWGIALYVNGSVDESVEKMSQFLANGNDTADFEELVSNALEKVSTTKGETRKITQTEISLLLKKARQKRDMALKKAQANEPDTVHSPVSATVDSLQGQEPKAQKPKKTLTPAGEKAAGSADFASMLLWMVN